MRFASSSVLTTMVLPVTNHITFSSRRSKSMRSTASFAPWIMRSLSSGADALMVSKGKKFIGFLCCSFKYSIHLRKSRSTNSLLKTRTEYRKTVHQVPLCSLFTLYNDCVHVALHHNSDGQFVRPLLHFAQVDDSASHPRKRLDEIIKNSTPVFFALCMSLIHSRISQL